MKKLMVYLDEDMHEDLRQLAFRKKTAMAALVRYALDKTFEDELDGIIGEMRLKEHLQDPSGAVTIEEFMKEHGIELPRRVPARSKEGTRRAAS